MTNKNNIICLGVKKLYQDKKVQYPPPTIPSLCFFEFTQSLQATIDSAIKLLYKHNLHEVVIQISELNWYFNLTNRYHHSIQSLMHVDAMNIHFSGVLKPFNEAHFTTAKININKLKFNKIPIKVINLKQLTIPLAKGLINKIQLLSNQLSQQEDLYYGIEPIIEKLRSFDKIATSNIHLQTELQLDFLSRKSNEIFAQMEKIETEMNSLSSQLLYQIFGLQKGDWFSYIESKDNKLVQLQFEQCRVYDNTLNIIGPGITKAGLLGKREQYANIEFGENE